MATMAARGADLSVSVGRVFERAFATIRHHPAATMGIAFIFGLIPTVLSTYLFSEPAANDAVDATAVALMVVNGLAWIVMAGLTQGALTSLIVAEAQGHRASFRDGLVAVLAVCGAVAMLSLVSSIAIGLGLLLLIVPGAILYVIWSVATPVLVAERRGVFGSLGRSRALTKGARWPVFAIVLILMAIYVLTTAVVEVVGGWADGRSYLSSDNPSVGTLVASGITGIVTNLLSAAVFASLYVELRNWKDGPDPQDLADVFG